MVRNTKGLEIFLEKGGTVPANVVPTAITAAKPAEVTVADVTGLKAGMLVKLSGTDFAELDGKTFVIGNIQTAGNTFDLIGSDTTGSTATLGGTPKAEYFVDGTDLIKLCLASIGVNGEEPSSVSVATFCDPSAAVAGSAAGAGTLSLGGWMDTTDAGYKLLIDAEADGVQRALQIRFPGAGGYLFAEGTISSFLLSDIPIDGAVAFTATMQLASKPVHMF